ncbi:MAG: alanyl-tRNA editing protein [Gemmatimonadaceae bacterium]|nr:alanyl-tRNA editing protein [Gemmatimonadaceae bacterium]
MTERLYYTDSYLRSFRARVVERSDDARAVVLDRTACYPTSGGQPHDLGTINGIAIRDVVDEDTRIVHHLDAPLAGGDEVQVEIDWSRRYDLMQQHTGQHLISAIAADRFGWPTVSVHMGESCTVDLAADSVPHKKLVEWERLANEAVAAVHAVHITSEESPSGLRKPTERSGAVRVVTIDGVDRSACGGTHLRSTAEIGAVLLGRTEKVRQGVRVEFVCGARAIARARADRDVLTALSQSLTSSIAELPAAVTRLADDARTLASERKRMVESLAGYEAAARAAAVVPDAQGLRTIVDRLDHAPDDLVRARAQAFSALSSVRYLAIGANAFVFATSAERGIDAGKLVKESLAALGGRGGGSPRVAQGTVPSNEAAAQLLTRLLGA